MAASGNKRDAEFANGFLDVLNGHVSLLNGTSAHCRPKAMLGTPFGAVTGDLACVYESPDRNGNTLLIVEREGSAPGNERNILKWFHPLKRGGKIDVFRGQSIVQCKFDRVSLLLAFARNKKWGVSDFKKTSAFCDLLAEIVNDYGREDTCLPFSARVATFDGAVDEDQWDECGRYFGDLAIKLFNT